jgi:hypothetical protein
VNDPFAAIAQPSAPPPPTPGGGDPFSSIAQASTPQMPLSSGFHDLTANPNAEGTYKMDNGGAQLDVPYSTVANARKQGYGFSSGDDMKRYMDDYVADPRTTKTAMDHLEKFLTNVSAGGIDRFAGIGGAALRTAQGAARIGGVIPIPLPKALQAAAAAENANANQSLGDVGETGAEFFTGEELLNLFGRGADTVMGAERAAKAAKFLRDNTAVARLARIGLNVVKQGTLAGAQTAVKGGTAQQAGESAAETAGLAGLFGVGGEALSGYLSHLSPEARTIEGVRMDVPKPGAPMERVQGQGAQAVREAARGAVRDNIESMADIGTSRDAIDNPQRQLPPPAVEIPTDLQRLIAGGQVEGTVPARGAVGGPTKIPEGTRSPALPEHYSFERVPFSTPDYVGSGTQPGETLTQPEGTTPEGKPRPNAGKPVQPAAMTGQNAGVLRITEPGQAQRMLSALSNAKLGELDAGTAARVEDIRGALERLANTGEAGPARWTLPTPKVDTENLINSIQDFTGAGDRLTELNNRAYEYLDQASSGRFRPLNEAIKNAQQSVYNGVPGAGKAYAQKLAEMGTLLQRIRATPGGLSPEDLSAIKASWRQSFILKDLGRTLDGSLNGLPGDTKVSNVQRGVDGNKLMSGLRRAINVHGRQTVEQAMGPGRLQNLENIARATATNAGRAKLNNAMREVGKHLPAYLGYKLGEHFGGFAGGLAGAASGEVAARMTRRVLDAVRTNPAIGEQLLYAIDYGVPPSSYGPHLARAIVDSAHAASRALPAARAAAVEQSNRSDGSEEP